MHVSDLFFTNVWDLFCAYNPGGCNDVKISQYSNTWVTQRPVLNLVKNFLLTYLQSYAFIFFLAHSIDEPLSISVPPNPKKGEKTGEVSVYLTFI